MINWYRVLKALNPECEREVSSLEDALKHLYEEKGLSLEKIISLANKDSLLIIHPGTLSKKLTSLGIKVRPRGGDNCSKDIPLTLEDFEQNSARELAVKFDVHITTIYERKKKLLTSS